MTESTLAAPDALWAYSAALRGRPCEVLADDGGGRLPVARWAGPVTEADRRLLDHCVGPTLDVGCGPGRLAAELSARGQDCLGIDVSPEAVALARGRGAHAEVADVFGVVPGRGRWRTALLADGNIGIGGDPARLLARVGSLLADGGVVVADLAPAGVRTRTARVRLRVGEVHSEPFRWGIVGVDGIGSLAARTGLVVTSLTRSVERPVVVLTRPGP